MEDQSEATSQPCRLLELPAELRLRIYSFALAPTGRLYLHRTPNKRRAVTPAISPALLATNRQIHAEAAGVLYTENTVHIALDAHDTTWPAIDEARLPQRVLQKLEHLCVLLDCTAALWRGYGAVDFEAFTALTALRSLRVRALVLPDWDESEEDEEADGDEGGAAAAVPAPAGETEPSEPTWKFPGFSRLAPEILERVPASTRIYYGPDLVPDGSEGVMDHLATSTSGALAPFDEFYTPKFKLSTMPGQRHDAEAREVSTEDLQAGAEAAHLEGGRGCKAGTVKDVWGEYRELFLGRMATRI